jgi:beta-N-acetylhexosaminidase
MNSIIKNLGQNFMIGIPGEEVNDEFLNFIKEYNIGGVLFLGKNYTSLQKLLETVNRLQGACSTLPLFTAVDHEGGRVQRFKEPFTILPAYKDLAKTKSSKELFEIFMLISKELLSAGINFNLSPVADMTDKTDGVIGDRSIGTELEKVEAVISATIRGFVKGQMLCCVKHFPGHGCVDEDSHNELPVSEKTLEELMNYEILPFKRATKSGVSSIMTSHILFKNIDSLPVSLSPIFIRDIIRKEFRFIKLILSDDISMGAITKTYSALEASTLALKAGTDIVIYSSSNINDLANLIEGIAQKTETDSELKNNIMSSYSRISEIKKGLSFKNLSYETTMDYLQKSELKNMI